jgi:hypothetical protein
MQLAGFNKILLKSQVCIQLSVTVDRTVDLSHFMLK